MALHTPAVQGDDLMTIQWQPTVDPVISTSGGFKAPAEDTKYQRWTPTTSSGYRLTVVNTDQLRWSKTTRISGTSTLSSLLSFCADLLSPQPSAWLYPLLPGHLSGYNEIPPYESFNIFITSSYFLCSYSAIFFPAKMYCGNIVFQILLNAVHKFFL